MTYSPLEQELRNAIGYNITLSIAGHPEIARGYRTAEDGDGLVARILPIIERYRDEAAVARATLAAQAAADQTLMRAVDQYTDGSREALELVEVLEAWRHDGRDPAELFDAMKAAAMKEAEIRYPRNHVVDDPFGETGEAQSDPYGYDEYASRAFVAGAEWQAGRGIRATPTEGASS